MTQTIVRLEAQNVKRIKAVTITPEGNTVVLGGVNSAGKTSVLDAIAMAFGGGRAIPDTPIRNGERKAQIVAQTQELTVTRKFDTKGSKLEVKGKDGVKMTSPQKVLDALVGKLTFDPLEFTRFDSQKQQTTLRELSGCDLADVERERAVAYDARTEVGRTVKATQARMEAAPFHEGAPEAEVSVGELLTELERVNAANEERRLQRKGLEDMRATSVDIQETIKEAKAKLLDLEKTLEQAIEAGKKQVARVTELGVDEDCSAVKAKLDTLEEDNRKARENAAHIALVAEWETAIAKHEELSESVKKCDEKKAELLADAKFPVAGLGFSEDGITLNGVPFEQAGQAEQIRVSVAMGLALNPELRVLLIRDGSLLDENSLRIVAELAEKAEAQVWIEKVSDNGDGCSVVIEAGEVKS
jgi:DNA repair exonuclease SbcCD ATPase subunit